MMLEATAGARVACWWVAVITRTADRDAARDRQEEVASDVHDQLSDALDRSTLSRGSRSVLGRVVRGVPSDIAWRAALELTPRRFTWHVRNPSTAITTLFVVMFPLNMVADSAGRTPSSFIDYRVPLWILTDLFGCFILVFAALAIAVRVVPGLSHGADAYRGRTRLERGRRTATAAMGVAWAGSAVFRFGSASIVGAGFWAAFGLCLFFYLLLLTVGLGVRLLTLGRYLPKVAS